MTDRGEPLRYGDRARQRVRDHGFDHVRELMTRVPRRQLVRIVSALPRVNGFRPDHVPDEKARRLAVRIATTGDADERDWATFARLWTAWCSEMLPPNSLNDVLSVDDAVPIQSRGKQLRPSFEDLARRGNVAREILDTMIMLSPFDEVESLLPATLLAPSRQSLGQAQQLEEMRTRLSSAEKRLDDLTASLTDRQDAAAEEMQTIRSLVESSRAELSQFRETSSEGGASKLASDVDHLQKEIKLVAESFESAVGDIREFVGALSGQTTAVAESLASLSTRVHAPNVSTPTPGPYESPLLDSARLSIIVTTQRDIPDGETAALFEVHSIRAAIESAVFAVGLQRDTSEDVSHEILAGIVARQLISLRGALALPLLKAISAAFPGEWDLGYVPIGLGDATALHGWHENVAPTRNLALLGVNNSAFEVYADAIRCDVAANQFRKGPNARIYIAIVTEGPAALPLTRSYAELGPIIDADALQWRLTAAATAERLGPVDVDRLRSQFDFVRSLGDSKDDLDVALEPFSGILSPLGRQSITRAFAALLSIRGDDAEAECWRSLYYSWLHPLLRATNAKKQRVQTWGGQSNWADAIVTDRGKYLFGQLPD